MAERESAVPTAGRAVLLVEPSELFRRVLAGPMRAAGFTVACAADEGEALGVLGRGVDAVVADRRIAGGSVLGAAAACGRRPRLIGLGEPAAGAAAAPFEACFSKFDREGLVEALAASPGTR
jgi:CheY-like chemotaxis protein